MQVHSPEASRMDLKQDTHCDLTRSSRLFARHFGLSIMLLGLLFTSVLLGCHRSEFGSDQGTSCPEPDGSLIVLDYTLNCLYVGDTPETGCPPTLPNDYFYRETFICSERSGAQNQYLTQLVDLLLDVDASIPSDMAAAQDSGLDMTLNSGPSTTQTADSGSTDPSPTPEPEPAD